VQKLMAVGLLIFLLGLALIFLGAATQGGSSAGGFILIGPFPIVFGSGPGGTALAILSIALGAAMLALVFLWSRRIFRGGS